MKFVKWYERGFCFPDGDNKSENNLLFMFIPLDKSSQVDEIYYLYPYKSLYWEYIISEYDLISEIKYTNIITMVYFYEILKLKIQGLLTYYLDIGSY